MNSSPLTNLDATSLATLAHGFRLGPLGYDVSEESLRKALPNLDSQCREELLRLANDEQWSPAQIAYLLQSLHTSKTTSTSLSHLFELVLSGPKTNAVPTRDTQAVFKELISTAQTEVILASYAIYNGKELFSSLIEKLKTIDGFKTTIFLDIPRGHGDTTTAEQIVAKYQHDFFTKQWTSDTRPSIHYLKSSLHTDWKTRSSMHAKLIIIDRTTVMITSANLTKAAQTKNIEAGVIVSDKNTAERLANHFESLAEDGSFCRL